MRQLGFGLKAAFLLVLAGAALGLALPAYEPQLQALLPFPPSASEPVPAGGPGAIQPYLCPQDQCAERLISFIGTAEESVHVMIYSFTKREIAEALVQAKHRGVEVQVLMDSLQSKNQYSQEAFLRESGIEVRIRDPPGTAIFHDKVSIVDRMAVSTGSFNYTQNADEGSAENVVILYDTPTAQKFEAEFQRYWQEGE